MHALLPPYKGKENPHFPSPKKETPNDNTSFRKGDVLRMMNYSDPWKKREPMIH